MNLLLDTCAALWHTEGSSELSQTAKRMVDDPDNTIFVSLASAWEIAIKTRLGKIRVDGGADGFCSRCIASGFRIAPILRQHVVAVETLPLLHRDPFDRVIVATAIAGGMTVLTSDENIWKYPVKWAW